MFHIVQEALTNVRKHSGAARAEIRFATDGARLEVDVVDDGNGMVVSPAVGDRPRYGLRTMRERADMIGATVDWTTPPDGGCRVRLAVPAGVQVPQPAVPAGTV